MTCGAADDTIAGRERGWGIRGCVRRTAQSRHVAAMALVMGLCLAISLGLSACAGGSANATGADTPTPLPTATPAPPPRVLYTADWSHGADGWTLPPHWFVQNGALVNDGQGVDPIGIPFSITAPHYTIEMQVQVEGYTCQRTCNEYGLSAQAPDGSNLYVAQIYGIEFISPHHGFALLSTPRPQDPRYGVATQDFNAGVNTRPYTVTVDGDSVSYAISGSGVGSVAVSVPLAPSSLSITDEHTQLSVTSLTITTP
jgi:hypothetical protein